MIIQTSILHDVLCIGASHVALKNSPANAGDVRDASSIAGLGRSPGQGHGNPLQYSCLENIMDRGDLWTIAHEVTESDTTKQLSIAHSTLIVV